MNKSNIIKSLVVLFAFVISFSITYTVKRYINNDTTIETIANEEEISKEETTSVSTNDFVKSELKQATAGAIATISAAADIVAAATSVAEGLKSTEGEIDDITRNSIVAATKIIEAAQELTAAGAEIDDVTANSIATAKEIIAAAQELTAAGAEIDDVTANSIATATKIIEATQELVTDATPVNETTKPYLLDVTFGSPKCNYSTLAYNFSVKINNLPSKAVAKFAIYDNIKRDTVAKSDDGLFKNVPSNDSGMYQLYIQWRDSLGYQGFGIDTLINGFNHFEKPKMAKLEAADLERQINNRDRKLVTRNNKISSTMQLSFTNIREDEKCPETIDEIFNKITFGMWTSIEVSSVEYNDDNQIVLITIKINHSEE